MNRYPAWKYVVIVVALAIGLIYALPNVFGDAPAVQVTSGKATVKVDASMMTRIDGLLKQANIVTTGMFFDNGQSPSVRVRVADGDDRAEAVGGGRDVLVGHAPRVHRRRVDAQGRRSRAGSTGDRATTGRRRAAPARSARCRAGGRR